MVQGEHGRRRKAGHIWSANLLLLTLSRAANTIGGPSLDCERSSISRALTSPKCTKSGGVGSRVAGLAALAVLCSDFQASTSRPPRKCSAVHGSAALKNSRMTSFSGCSWLFCGAKQPPQRVITEKSVSGSSKSHHDITINNICQFDNKPLVDQRCGARCVIRDMPAAGTERYRWTVTVIGEPTRVPRRSRAAAKIPKAVGFTQSYAVAKRERRDDRPRQRDRGQP